MSQDLRLVIFDVDGTLIDSEAHILAAMHRAFESQSVPLPPQREMVSKIGLSLPLVFAELLPDGDAVLIGRLIEAYKTAFSELRESGNAAVNSPLFPGAAELIATLFAEPETILGIATGKSRRGLDAALAHHDLERYFFTVQVADSHPSKPHPSMVETAMSDAGVSSERTIIIGDTSYDMEMGLAAGVTCIGVTWGNHDPEKIAAAGAHAMVESFSELAEILSEIGQEK